MDIKIETGPQVLLLIDWDNLFHSIASFFESVEEIRIEDRIAKIREWVDCEVGPLLGGHGFVFAPEHLSLAHQEICVKHGLKLVICPKKILAEPERNPKTGQMENEHDTVDETIIWFAQMMITNTAFDTICLVSGDNDYLHLFKQMKVYGKKRALVAPTNNSLAKNGDDLLVEQVDINPANRKMMLVLVDKAV
jgi:hypothetical protein